MVTSGRSAARLKASTITESVIAMTVISISFVVGLKVFEYGLNGFSNGQDLRVEVMMQTLSTEAKIDGIVKPNMVGPDFRIEQTFSKHPTANHVYQLSQMGYDHRDKLIRSNTIYLYHSKELIFE